MIAPCKDCPDRHIGCHGKCEKYQEYDAEQKKIREARFNDKSRDFARSLLPPAKAKKMREDSRRNK